jgi:hypothetical protein
MKARIAKFGQNRLQVKNGERRQSHYVMIKWLVYQVDMTIVDICT